MKPNLKVHIKLSSQSLKEKTLKIIEYKGGQGEERC